MKRWLLIPVAFPTVLAAQETPADNLFTWSGRVAANCTLAVRHYNGPIDVREGTSDRVEFRAERRTRRSNELTFQVENTAEGVTICGVWRGRSACDEGRRGWGGDWDDGPPSSRLSVTLPKGGRLRANTGNGDVPVEKASH